MNQTTQDAPEAKGPSETTNSPEASNRPAARVHPRFTKPQRVAFVQSAWHREVIDRKSTRLNSSHANISYAVFCLGRVTALIAHELGLLAVIGVARMHGLHGCGCGEGVAFVSSLFSFLVKYALVSTRYVMGVSAGF